MKIDRKVSEIDHGNLVIDAEEVINVINKLSDQELKLWVYLNCKVGDEVIDLDFGDAVRDLRWYYEEVTDIFAALGYDGFLYEEDEVVHVRDYWSDEPAYILTSCERIKYDY